MDTNILLSDMNYLKTILKSNTEKISVADIVLVELNQIKNKDCRMKSNARKAIQFLHQNMNRIQFQSIEEDKEHVISISCNDDLVLNWCIILSSRGHDVRLYTKDQWLAVRAYANGIQEYRRLIPKE